MLRTKKMIDPPSGSMYGFPKEIPDVKDLDINTWLVENGYPQEQIDKFGGAVPCGVWLEERP